VSVFDQCFAIVVGIEGGLSLDPSDPGNYTGGHVGLGVLKGTKFGISAASYPDLDIANLTLDQAKAIYQSDYWIEVSADLMPPPLALLVFDAAVNNGVCQAKHLLQQALGVTVDGVIGPQTEAALSAAMKSDVSALCAEFQARRVVFMSGLTLWYRDGLGWARRLTSLPYKGATITP